jgi:hypothetical protein
MSWNIHKSNLMYVLSILLITGFLATSLTSYFVSRASLRVEISEHELPLTSDNIYSEIQQDLLRPVFVSSLMATDTFLRDWVIDGERDPQQITRYLNEIQLKYNTFTSFFVSEKTRTYYHAFGILKKVSPDSARDHWYFRVRELPQEYEINVDTDMANKDAMTIFINYRVFDYENNYIGATGVGLTVSAVKELIEVYQQKYNRTVYFIDRTGAIQLAGARFYQQNQNISKFEYFREFQERLGTKSEQAFTYQKDGQTIHTSIRYIGEFGWYLVVEQSEKEAVRGIFLTLVLNLVFCLLITLVVLLMVNWSVNAYQKRIETLRGIVPICSYCKQIRDDKGYWKEVEAYVAKYTDAQFSHSICPVCMEKHHPEEYAEMKQEEMDGD